LPPEALPGSQLRMDTAFRRFVFSLRASVLSCEPRQPLETSMGGQRLVR